MEQIGIDVHKVATQVCILTETGEYEERRIRTERDALTKMFGGRPRARVLLEAATESEWGARHLESLGHEVIVADPSFAPMYASRSRSIKTDKRDARALCEACRTGIYRPAHRSSDQSRDRRKQLLVREVLSDLCLRGISREAPFFEAHVHDKAPVITGLSRVRCGASRFHLCGALCPWLGPQLVGPDSRVHADALRRRRRSRAPAL